MNPHRLRLAEIDLSPEAAMAQACGFPRHDLEEFAAKPRLRPGFGALEAWLVLFRFAPPLLFLFAWARLVLIHLESQRRLLNLVVAPSLATSTAGECVRPATLRASAADSFERAMDVVLGPDAVVYGETETFEPAPSLVAAAGKA